MTRISIPYCLTALLFLGGIAQAADITQTAKLLPNSGEGASADRMGQSVAVSNDTAVVGAYLANESSGTIADAGTVHVFKRDSSTTWSRQQKISSPIPTASDQFGNAVAISGDTLVVAAVQDDETSASNSGAVYVYTRASNVWTLQQRLIASSATASAAFGRSVAVDGDTLIVGASQANSGTGAAYVFTRSGNTWAQQQILLASDAAANDYFGGSVAISGDRLIVGAERANVGTKIDVGAAYVFRRNGVGTWVAQTKLTPTTFTNDDNFGISVSISGATIVVGQPYLGEGVDSNKGAAIVFVEQAGTWVNQATLVASDAKANDFFGRSVAISGDLLVSGSYFDDFSTVVNGGSSYLFRRTGSNWTQTDKLLGNDTELNDLIGSSVAMSAGATIVGAPFDGNAFGAEAGAAYAYTRNDATATALAVNTSAITYGQGVALTARVTGSIYPGATAPTGSVTFFNGATQLGSGAVSLSGDTAQLTLPNLPAGELNITAQYTPASSSFLSSSSPIKSVSVAKAATTLALVAAGGSSVPYGTNLSYTANLSVVGAPVPSGSIRFLDGGSLIGTAPLSAGVATFAISSLSVGGHSISAEYLGDANYLPFATATSSVSVVRAVTALTLTTLPSPSLDGSAIGLRATLNGGIPAGKLLNFEIVSPSPMPLGTLVSNATGVATFDTAALAVGSYQFRVTYFGDTNHFGSIGTSSTHNVLAIANLTITKTNEISSIQSGAATTYTIVATNNGPNPALGATVVDNIDDDLVTGLFLPNSPWTCTASGGATCNGNASESGQGDINLSVDLPVSGTVTFAVTSQSRVDAEPFIRNTASVVLPVTLGDPDTRDNSATDSDDSGVFKDSLEIVP